MTGNRKNEIIKNLINCRANPHDLEILTYSCSEKCSCVHSRTISVLQANETIHN